MFYIKTIHDGKETRHEFHNERYARGILRATYHEILENLEKETGRYEITGRAITDNEYRISVKDRSRLYFLGRPEDVRNVLYTGAIGRKVKGVLNA